MTFLICGLGSIGKRHLLILKGLGSHNFIAFRSGNSKANSSENAVVEISNLNEISKCKIDGALITNPTSLHITTAIEIAKNGIPIFIEKPLGRNLDRIDELKKLVVEKKIPVLIGYNLIYHPGIEAIKKCIKEKKNRKSNFSKSTVRVVYARLAQE